MPRHSQVDPPRLSLWPDDPRDVLITRLKEVEEYGVLAPREAAFDCRRARDLLRSTGTLGPA